MTRSLLPVILAAAGLATSVAMADGAGAAWGHRARERMVADALKVAPPVLARIIERHPESLRAGLDETTRSEGSPQHRLDSDDPSSGAAAAIEVVVRKAVAAVDGHRPMSDVVFYLGVLAHLAADVSDPLLTSPEGATVDFANDFPRYVERNLDRFPAVFYGYPAEPEEPGAAAIAAARLSREYYGHLARAYAASGGSSAGFDVRSIPFGIASLCYSRAVTGIARAWLQVWRGAHGDLAGTLHLAAGAAPETPRTAPAGAPVIRTAAPSHPRTTQKEPAPDIAEDQGTADASGGGDPDPAAPSKTILGKSRKRLREAEARAAKSAARPLPGDPNTPADPNG